MFTLIESILHVKEINIYYCPFNIIHCFFYKLIAKKYAELCEYLNTVELSEI